MKIVHILFLLSLFIPRASAQQTEIPIGFIGPLTGDLAHYGRNGDVVGVPYAVKQIRDGKVEQIDPRI